jgi:hypothetical protein
VIAVPDVGCSTDIGLPKNEIECRTDIGLPKNEIECSTDIARLNEH